VEESASVSTPSVASAVTSRYSSRASRLPGANRSAADRSRTIQRLALPMLYIRKKPKGFGRGAQIEGEMAPGCRCLLVEDLATDGGSKLNFIEAIRQAEGKVADALVVFHYGIFPQSISSLAAVGVRLHGLATWWDVLAAAEEAGRLAAAGIAAVRAFLENPEGWSLQHGGKVASDAAASERSDLSSLKPVQI
jgi:hypothetical protein